MTDIKSCKHCGGISISTAKYCEYCNQPFEEKPLKKREEGYIWARSVLDGTLTKVIQYKQGVIMTKFKYTHPKSKKEIEVTLHGDFDKVKLFRIWADYRSSKALTHKNYYYVYAWTIKQAKDYFKKKITWLNIYSIKALSEEERIEIENKPPEKKIVLNENNYNIMKAILQKR